MKKKLLIRGVALALLLTAWLLYTRPMPLAQMYRMDLEMVTQMHVSAREIVASTEANGTVDQVRYAASLDPGDPGFDPIVAALRDRTFRRAPLTIHAEDTHKHQMQPGDICWTLIVETGDGGVLQIDNFYGRLTGGISPQLRLSTPDKAAWLTEVFDIIQENIAPAQSAS